MDTETFRRLLVVAIKLIDPKMELIPARCNLKIARSTLEPGCPNPEDKGGYTVHLVPAPLSTRALLNINKIEDGSNQKLKLFKRG